MLDRYAYGLGRVVLAPPFPLSSALDLLRATERTGDGARRSAGSTGALGI